MNLQQRKEVLEQLGRYMQENSEDFQRAKHKAFSENNWFTTEFVNLSAQNIATAYLTGEALQQLIDTYSIPDTQAAPKKVGIVMAGNIPMVGFHDFLCTFLSGHIAVIKPSSKDEALIKHLVHKIIEWVPEASTFIIISEMLKNCNAYIATGSNNSSRYFEHYFAKYPHIIRKNRTSIALLQGNETPEELEKLADDVHQYFGLGCRNVTKLYVPQQYNFIPLLEAFNKYQHFVNHHKYKNNYDYNLAIHILNNKYYMTNGSILLVEDASPFSPISQLHYEYYTHIEEVEKQLTNNQAIQCVVGKKATAFGKAQQPQVCDYADGVDTMNFLLSL